MHKTMYQNQTSTHNVGSPIYANNSPTAHITVNRSRLKLYGTNVYLKNGATFEIELWNPKQTRVLTKIMINGVNVSSGGIVVNPGQRVYLERFIDVDRKFLFSTYEIENSVEAVEASQLNGLVKVDFYDEQIVYPSYHTSTWVCGNQTITINPSLPIYRNDYYFANTGGLGLTLNNVQCSTAPTQPRSNLRKSSSASTYNSNACMDFCDAPMADQEQSTLETGRIEQGNKSNQQLIDVYGSFNSWTCNTYSYRILPESTKPSEIGEVRRKCPNCGAKVKSHWKACPICTTNLSI